MCCIQIYMKCLICLFHILSVRGFGLNTSKVTKDLLLTYQHCKKAEIYSIVVVWAAIRGQLSFWWVFSIDTMCYSCSSVLYSPWEVTAYYQWTLATDTQSILSSHTQKEQGACSVTGPKSELGTPTFLHVHIWIHSSFSRSDTYK